MAGTGEAEQFDFDAAGGEAIAHPDALFVCDVFVFGAVDDERWGGVGGDPVERAGQDVIVASLLEVTAEPQREDLVSIDTLAVGLSEVAGPVEIDDTGDGRGEPGVIGAIELGDTTGDAEKLSEVTSGGASGDSDAFWIDLESGGLGSDPAYGGFGIGHGCGERVFGSEPVAHGESGVAVLGEFDAERIVSLARPGAESAAVNAEHSGQEAGVRARASEVE